jgi:hypothetical protein
MYEHQSAWYYDVIAGWAVFGAVIGGMIIV